jgi:hypothetical protein
MTMIKHEEIMTALKADMLGEHYDFHILTVTHIPSDSDTCCVVYGCSAVTANLPDNFRASTVTRRRDGSVALGDGMIVKVAR